MKIRVHRPLSRLHVYIFSFPRLIIFGNSLTRRVVFGENLVTLEFLPAWNILARSSNGDFGGKIVGVWHIEPGRETDRYVYGSAGVCS